MGLNHARCVTAHPRTQLAMAVEPDEGRAKANIGCPVESTVVALIGQVDAAIIAVPTAMHAFVATPLLKAGISCLIEKPYVANAAEAEALMQTARDSEAVIRVGHIERFNPAVSVLLSRPPRNIRSITARRLNAASARVTDVDVVLDLMVHDIDVVLNLKGDKVTKLTAEGDRDQAIAKLTFDDGAVATIGASRKVTSVTRDLKVVGEKIEMTVDYQRRSLVEVRNESEGVRARTVDVPQHDPLTAQLSAFLAAREGKQTGVTPGEATAVMQVAWRIQAALKL
jgi:predicted dehydrogenase